MLTELSIDGFLTFGAVYPLCLWANYRARIATGFYRFNLGLAAFVLSLGVLALILDAGGVVGGTLASSSVLRAGAVLWLVALLGVTWAGWRRERPPLLMVTAPSLLGLLIVAALVVSRTPAAPAIAVATTVLGGATLSLALYAMILGHWYLNVAKLPLGHLATAVWAYSAFLALRLIWNAVALVAAQVDYQGLPLPLWQFVATLDGFLVGVALFFGTLLPLALAYLVQRTLVAKSTQSATGLLYVVVIAAIIGDFSYRFYQLRYGVLL